MPQKKIEAMTTEQIFEAFEQTNFMEGEHVPTLRGWLMDALEARNPEAFVAWIAHRALLTTRATFLNK